MLQGAGWRRCGNLARSVRLRALISAECTEMAGLFTAARPLVVRRFVARKCTDPAGCVLDCKTNDDCPATAYCAKPAGACDDAGLCRPRPTACTREYVPVCGCDGQTYPNACTAAAAGVNVRHPGPCGACDPTDPAACAPNQFCETLRSTCAVDTRGECVDVPQACPDVAHRAVPRMIEYAESAEDFNRNRVVIDRRGEGFDAPFASRESVCASAPGRVCDA